MTSRSKRRERWVEWKIGQALAEARKPSGGGEMTQAQQQERDLRFAKAMGWAHNGETFPLFTILKSPYDGSGRVFVSRQKDGGRVWDPHTNIADAVELAEKLDIYFGRSDKDGDWFCWARPSGTPTMERVDRDDLCTAICEAAWTKLEVEK